jgi:hypothetical protein
VTHREYGSVLPEPIYKRTVEHFGQEGVAELFYFVSIYSIISVTLTPSTYRRLNKASPDWMPVVRPEFGLEELCGKSVWDPLPKVKLPGDLRTPILEP